MLMQGLGSMLLKVCFLLILSHVVVESQSIIKSLPGFQGDLPFKLETGYEGVGALEDVQLFYYFVESERNPKADPLLLWLTGGPGCSAFSGLVYEIGPLKFDYANSSANAPTFILNPYSWTKVANIIFLDAPVGTGFSYAKSWQGYNTGDKLTAAQNYEFLRKWLMKHPQFQKNQLYICGDSYSGMIVPVVVQEISNGNEAGLKPLMNIQGYVLGNPMTDKHTYLNARILFAHRLALISDELYESTKENCKGEYVYVDPSNTLCLEDLQVVKECMNKVYTAQVLEPTCRRLSPQPNGLKWDPSFLQDNFIDLLDSPPKQHTEPWCRNYNYLFSYIWANNKTVQKALHIREGTIEDWVRCNESLSYAYDFTSIVDYHRNLIKKGYRVLIYSGDHDMAISYVDTRAWIKSLNLTVFAPWGPWFVDGQIAGYRIGYDEKKYELVFATVKGGGHTAPEYKPKECLAMIYRWFAYYPL